MSQYTVELGAENVHCQRYEPNFSIEIEISSRTSAKRLVGNRCFRFSNKRTELVSLLSKCFTLKDIF